MPPTVLDEAWAVITTPTTFASIVFPSTTSPVAEEPEIDTPAKVLKSIVLESAATVPPILTPLTLSISTPTTFPGGWSVPERSVPRKFPRIEALADST